MAEFVPNTGILCREKYPVREKEVTVKKIKKTVPEIDFDNQKTTIYNSDFKLTRYGNITEVIGFLANEGMEKVSDNPLYKKDYLNNIINAKIDEVDVTINRGDASAFEKHLKLTECNTMEDLENYGNNIFNI